MKLRSYAKINLTLDVVGKRSDGYHDIETVFQQVNLYDEIALKEEDKDISIKCNIKELENKHNIAYKTAELLQNKFKIDKGVEISLSKNIPIGAGLSGGSSNAAAVLKGLNIMWGLDLNKDELIKISKEIGMDVAFHLIGGTCYGQGRGEDIEKIKDLEEYFVLIVYPGFKVNTKYAYSKLNYDKIGKTMSSKNFCKDYDLGKLHNDFEYTVLTDEMKEIKKILGKNCLMSGSGSAVFGLYKDKKEATEVFSKIKEKYKTSFLAKTWNPEIELAQEMGFCFGVKRAIEEINKTRDKKVYILGKLIHNPQVIEELEQKGIKTIEDFEDINEGIIVISAHGIADSTIDKIKEKGLSVLDLTCPLVKKVHDITKEAESKGRKVILYGDKNHTEVRGIMGNLHNYKVIKDFNELKEEDFDCKLTIVSQTTREVRKFHKLADQIKKVSKDVEIKDTVCFSAKNKQKSSIEVAKKSDIMIVIGGRISSNTMRLLEICSEFCDSKLIETEKEINPDWLFHEKIGITAGASTPNSIIDGIVRRIKNAI